MPDPYIPKALYTSGALASLSGGQREIGRLNFGSPSEWRDTLELGDVSGYDVGTDPGDIPVLDGSGKLPTSTLPNLSITNTFVVASEAAMLALTVEVGDVAVRSDVNKTFILQTAGASTLGNWVELQSPTGAVSSVNGQTGTVVLNTSHVSESGNLYFTNARAKTALETGNVGIGGAPAYPLDVFVGSDRRLQFRYLDGFALINVTNDADSLSKPFWLNADSFRFGVAIGGSFDFRVNSSTVAGIDASGNTTLGNAKIGNVGFGAAYAGFCHSSRFNGSDYAFLHENTGQTYINAAAGTQINFRINNTNYAALSATSFTVSPQLVANGGVLIGANGGNNGTIDYAGNFGAAAIWLYNVGATTRWGCGLNGGEMQFFATTGDGTNHFSWNKGGDLQTSGTNELMRLQTNGKLGLGMSPATLLDVNGSFRSGVVALTDGATINTDVSLGNTFTVTLGGSRTMAAPSNPTNGQKIMYRIKQDGTGSRGITWNAVFKFDAGTPPVLKTAADAINYVSFVYIAADAKWEHIGEKGLA